MRKKEQFGRRMHSGRLKLSKIKHPIGVKEISKEVHKTTKRKLERRQKTNKERIVEGQYRSFSTSLMWAPGRSEK